MPSRSLITGVNMLQRNSQFVCFVGCINLKVLGQVEVSSTCLIMQSVTHHLKGILCGLCSDVPNYSTVSKKNSSLLHAT